MYFYPAYLAVRNKRYTRAEEKEKRNMCMKTKPLYRVTIIFVV